MFGPPTPVPKGFRYQKEFITPAEEAALIAEFQKLELKPFQFGEYEAKRRVTNFGDNGVPFPDWLTPLKNKAAKWAGFLPSDIIQAHLIEYSPGSPIGWHRDSPPYDSVIGVSLKSSCRFQLRRERADHKWIALK